ncbi:hypothetical protein PJ985_20430 [Streptomyces sp. ACA25]|uniref:hypothetical protein n=1 Tax=Streptomyces sp. ACA25 TaxID=3022596 RepID=UPI0023070C82|nr:hypothetical protein [Streptomyces sp. ACA25]MDB1089928.1 hypothetical protein [Streptomyces sp. ACA25]
MADQDTVDHPPADALPLPARRRHWPAAAAVAASVALLAGGIYGGQTLFGTAGDEAAGPEAAAPDATGNLEADSLASSDAARVVLVATEDLPDGPERAAVHRFSGSVGAAEVTELARALGLSGTPELRDGTWRVGAPAGSPDSPRSSGPAPDAPGAAQPVLTVSAEAPGEWSFHSYGDPGQPVPAPGTGTEDLPGAGKGGEGQGVDPSEGTDGRADAEPVMPGAPVDPVPEKTALAAARPLLETLGLQDAQLETEEQWGDSRTVRVADQVSGLPVHGADTVLEVGPGGELRSGYGRLLTPTADGEHPLLSAQEALDTLNGESAAQGSADAREDGAEVAPPEGSTEVPVTGAHLALSLEHAGAEPLLVPVWVFEAGERDARYAVTQPAVDPGTLGLRDGEAGDGGHPGAGAAEPGSPGQVEPAPPLEPLPPDAPGGPGDVPDLTDAGMSVDAYGPGDRVLTLHFWGGVCDEYAGAAEESGDTVRLRTETVGGTDDVCIMIAERTSVRVKLDAPVGDRTLVDERGEEIPVR